MMIHLKRPTLLFVLAVFLSQFDAFGQFRSAEEAQRMADSFWPMKRKAGEPAPKQQMVYTEKDSVNSQPYFYIFNRGDNEGFVIISADNRSKKILGYSDTGCFDVNNVPAEMQAWLKVYHKELHELSMTPDSLLNMDLGDLVLSKGRSKGSQAFARAVEPLLGSINYGQSNPYNLLCPQINGKSCVTGCVATAASQVMRYWQHPTQPTGKSHSYLLNGQTIGTSYTTAYDWNNMLTSYSNARSNAQQQQAVARLMVDAGIACNMSYSPSASGAVTQDMALGLIDLFGFDRGIMVYQRADFTSADFVYYLKRELNAGRPVLVSGQGSGGGHCFVCDGYDANGLFHINWGWNGMSNGYFELTNLSPSSLGVGGGSGGFNDQVCFVGGIQPPAANALPVYVLSFRQITVALEAKTGKTSSFTLQQLANASLYDFNGQVGVGLYQNGQLTQVLGAARLSLPRFSRVPNLKINAKVPSSLPNGQYQFVIVCQSSADGLWRSCLSSSCNCIDVTISNKTVTGAMNYSTHYCDLPDNGFDRSATTQDDETTDGGQQAETDATPAQPTGSSPLVLAAPIAFAANNQGVTSGNQTVIARLTATQDYSDKLGVFIYDQSMQQCVATLQAGTATLRGGQTSDCSFNGVLSLQPGNYYVALFYVNGSKGWQQVPKNEWSCVPFTLTNSQEKRMVASYANVRPGEEGGAEEPDMTSAVISSTQDMAYFNQPLDDHFYDDDEEETGFSDFDEEVFSKAVDNKAPFTCQEMRFKDVDPDFVDDRLVYVFHPGSTARINYTLFSKHEEPQTRILTLSLFDKDDRWVTDLAERLVTVKGKVSGAFQISFADVQPGAYKLRLTEASHAQDVSHPVPPRPTSSVLVQVVPPSL